MRELQSMGPPYFGRTPLMESVSGTYLPAENIPLLLNARADVNEHDSLQRTALWWASTTGHTRAVEILLTARASVDDPCSLNGETALMRAASNGHPDAVKLLLEANAQLNLVDRRKKTALLHTATRCAQCIKALHAARADLDLLDQRGSTALMNASSFGSENIVKALLEAKANVNLPKPYEEKGTTALMGAATPEISQLLIEAQANIHAITDSGNTSLLSAIRRGEVAIASLLLDAKANLSDQAIKIAKTIKPPFMFQEEVDSKRTTLVNLLQRSFPKSPPNGPVLEPKLD